MLGLQLVTSDTTRFFQFSPQISVANNSSTAVLGGDLKTLPCSQIWTRAGDVILTDLWSDL